MDLEFSSKIGAVGNVVKCVLYWLHKQFQIASVVQWYSFHFMSGRVRVHTVFSFFVLHSIKQKRKSNCFIPFFVFHIIKQKLKYEKQNQLPFIVSQTIKHNAKYERLFFSQTPFSVYHSAVWNWKYDSWYRLS